MQLTAEEQQRYLRQLSLPEIGIKGQEKLKTSKVACIGLGGLGTVAATYLTAAGIGTLGLIDGDYIETSNLSRQILFTSQDVGKLKVEIAYQRLHELNPHVSLQRHPTPLTGNNATEILVPYDIVMDCSDNFKTRYLINDVCCTLNKPNVFASILGFSGTLSVFCTAHGPCYRCLYPQSSSAASASIPNCADHGVLGVLPGILGTLQAAETIKYLLQMDYSLVGQLLWIDVLGLQFKTLKIPRMSECTTCHRLQPTLVCESIPPEMTVEQFYQLKDSPDIFVLDVRQPEEYAICHLGGYLIPSTELQERLAEIPHDKTIVVHCRTGGRSRIMTQYLQENGYPRVFNLTGGIMAWKEKIDPSLPSY